MLRPQRERSTPSTGRGSRAGLGTGKLNPPPAAYMFCLLVGFRLLNTLTLRTFFQPDEFFQSLEPAWQAAFGSLGTRRGAWITWEWTYQLRSSIHPLLFSGVYCVADLIAKTVDVEPGLRADLLVAAPKILQAVIAALLDFATWRLSAKFFGLHSGAAWTTLALTLCSPWQWFCSTRTLSNCLETCLTATALWLWPWHWPAPTTSNDVHDEQGLRSETYRASRTSSSRSSDLSSLRMSLFLAALACILRPTNLLIWLCVCTGTLRNATARETRVLVREAVVLGSFVLGLSILVDRVHYGSWTLPPIRFIYFNVAQSLAVFYGKNRADYYFTEGLPLLLTTALPWTVIGVARAIRGLIRPCQNPGQGADEAQVRLGPRLRILALTCLFVTAVLSLISHKEVRFAYPLLPILHVLAAEPVYSFFSVWSNGRKALLYALLGTNLVIAWYTSQVHQRGVIDVMTFLRKEGSSMSSSQTRSAAFLMPCHSTPWRSHLVFDNLEAQALTCEPPVHVPLADRDRYLDEADQFYLDPVKWLDISWPQEVDSVSSEFRDDASDEGAQSIPKNLAGSRGSGVQDGQGGRYWPDYLVFFEQLEDTLSSVLDGNLYHECWRGFNTHWHDDWRRHGDVIVWCMDRGEDNKTSR
ncbi:Alg9-like mannosyltransferase family-domain-containing protein [Lineolata rhizophorae]|uniref:Mannosyltransferase n=1 Tax=Lineolata rhizophorae TaxID=578093 RepID=A0A6A6PCY9_9PEZI|nr:Alg9-like mannosyltransferase family-domain-containing protein [Lineolata rhizophorae]